MEALAEKFEEMGFAKPVKEVIEDEELETAEDDAPLEEGEEAEKEGEEEESAPKEDDEYDREIRIAIVGKPNVGKVPRPNSDPKHNPKHDLGCALSFTLRPKSHPPVLCALTFTL